jgi:hypothetical protein
MVMVRPVLPVWWSMVRHFLVAMSISIDADFSHPPVSEIIEIQPGSEMQLFLV